MEALVFTSQEGKDRDGRGLVEEGEIPREEEVDGENVGEEDFVAQHQRFG